jgi:hypothetical protein
VTGIGVWRIADGKMREEWIAEDPLGVLHQLGATLPPPDALGRRSTSG